MPSDPIPPRILALAMLLQTVINRRTQASVEAKDEARASTLPRQSPRNIVRKIGAAETLLEAAVRHVRLGEERIARQRELIAQMAQRGQPTGDAEGLLRTFEELQAQHVAHRDRLLLRLSH